MLQTILTLTLCALLAVPPSVWAQDASGTSAPGVAPDGTWPRRITSGDKTLTIYQPQLQKWDGNQLEGRAAVSVESQVNPTPSFGIVWFTARTEVDRQNRLVNLQGLTLTRASFPTLSQNSAEYLAAIQKSVPAGVRTISLDRLQANLTVTQAESKHAAVQVKNDPPRILFSSTPAFLVMIDGQPVLRALQGTNLLRVINTRVFLVLDQAGGTYYLRIMGQWMSAGALTGQWDLVLSPPAYLQAALDAGRKANLPVDPLDDPGPIVKGTFDQGISPTIYVSEGPAELVQTDGAPNFQPIDGTLLVSVQNSTANMIVDLSSQIYYVLLSGRWFRSAFLNGPWQFVASKDLPPDFAKIPENHPKGVVLASVAGTPQAQESVIDNRIPQTATVNRSEAKLTVAYDGQPQFKPIEATPLQYAVNTGTPVIMVSPQSYYAVQNGVWFVAPAPSGPWAVAASVPQVIYTIPASSPLYYVTYVQIYGATPQVVYTGYTPGYLGTVVAPDAVVVYGTGYVYPAYVGAVYYPPPLTYGYGAGFAWGASTGFLFGYAAGALVGGAVWRGGCCWGGGNNNININQNYYNNWGKTAVNSNTIQNRLRSATPQQRAQARQGAGQNNVFAGQDGNVYRRGDDGNWQRNQAGNNWQRMDAGRGEGAGQQFGESLGSLDRESFGRNLGQQRAGGWQGGGGFAGRGGGFSGGGSRGRR